MVPFFRQCIFLYPAVFHFVEDGGDFLRRRGVKKAHDVNREGGEEEAGDDFVQAEQRELFPDQDGQAADYDAGEDAVSCGAPPEEGGQDRRAEGRAEARPRVGHDVKDEAVGIQRQRHSDRCDDEGGNAVYPDQFVFARVFPQQGVVKVLREGGGGDEKLGGHGAHDGRQHGGEDDAGEERREEFVRHQQEDGLGAGAVELPFEERAAHHADEYGGGEGDDDPDHGDAGGAPDFAGGPDGHEAH